MRDLFILTIHLIVTLAKMVGPGGVRGVAAESLLLKQQLLVSNRSRKRSPNLTSLDGSYSDSSAYSSARPESQRWPWFSSR